MAISNSKFLISLKKRVGFLEKFFNFFCDSGYLLYNKLAIKKTHVQKMMVVGMRMISWIR